MTSSGNSLAPDGYTPNFIAKNYGPKHLSAQSGFYHTIMPLATGTQTTTNFAMSTITLSPKLSNDSIATTTAKQHLAFQMQEGELVVTINGEMDLLEKGAERRLLALPIQRALGHLPS